LIKNYVLQRCNAPGTNSNVLLGPAPQDRLTWAQAYSDGSPVFYFLDDGSKAEWGVGTFRAGNPATVSRDTVVGNTSGTTAILNFTAAVDCYNEIPGERMPFINGGIINAPSARLDTHAGGMPIGASVDFWGTVAPAGWVFANGQSLSRTSYALLFAVLSTTYGAPDANTFRVPNRCESVAVGRATMGGAATVSVRGMQLIPNISVLGTRIGHQDLETHAHTLNLTDPGHTHPVSDPGHSHVYAFPILVGSPGIASGPDLVLTVGPADTSVSASNTAVIGSFTGITASVAENGTGDMGNIPPALVCNVILYAGPVP